MSDGAADEPWERKDGESAAAFAAFVAYRDLGPARSVTKMARQLEKSRSLLGRWSRKYAWVMRAAAYDREFVAEQQRARRDIAHRHAKLAQAFLGKAVARLQVLDPRELTPGELLRYFQVATEVERRAVGDELVTAERRDGADGVEVGALTDEERRRRMEELRRELGAVCRGRSGEPRMGEAAGDGESG